MDFNKQEAQNIGPAPQYYPSAAQQPQYQPSTATEQLGEQYRAQCVFLSFF
jgi:hypothetical protein